TGRSWPALRARHRSHVQKHYPSAERQMAPERIFRFIAGCLARAEPIACLDKLESASTRESGSPYYARGAPCAPPSVRRSEGRRYPAPAASVRSAIGRYAVPAAQWAQARAGRPPARGRQEATAAHLRAHSRATRSAHQQQVDRPAISRVRERLASV